MSEEQQEQQSGKQAVISSVAEESTQAEHRQLRKPREPSVNETAALIADTLGETEEGPCEQLLHIVWVLGRTQARALLERTREIEARQGLLIPDGSRRRTPGGVYFHLVYTEGKPKPGRRLRKHKKQRAKKQRYSHKCKIRGIVLAGPREDRLFCATQETFVM